MPTKQPSVLKIILAAPNQLPLLSNAPIHPKTVLKTIILMDIMPFTVLSLACKR